MKNFVVDTEFGMTIKKASTFEQAHKSALAEVGTYNLRSIREATQEDTDWYLNMGGNKDNVAQIEDSRA